MWAFNRPTVQSVFHPEEDLKHYFIAPKIRFLVRLSPTNKKNIHITKNHEEIFLKILKNENSYFCEMQTPWSRLK